jgi:hypothetical protein
LNTATLKVEKLNGFPFVVNFEKGLSSGTFNEALTMRMSQSMNEICLRAEKHIEAKENSRVKGSREIGSRGRSNKDRIEGVC